MIDRTTETTQIGLDEFPIETGTATDGSKKRIHTVYNTA
jgi:hypothetical protein